LVETGKGSISCQNHTIHVWAMDGGGDHFRECPEPEGGAPTGVVIACARTASDSGSPPQTSVLPRPRVPIPPEKLPQRQFLTL
jgi:hypothetical protein